MTRSPLTQSLQSIASVAAESHAEGAEVEEVLAVRHARRLNRREFFGRALKAGALAAGVGMWPRAARAGRGRRSPRVAVVGAGLAGLTCAYRLRKAGYLATVYEADSRVGGRCFTRRGFFQDGQTAERGGEFIDTGHMALRRLAHEFDLPLDDLLRAEPRGTEPVYFFDGAPYSLAQATADFRSIVPKLQRDLRAADYPTLHDDFTPRGAELDRMSVRDWILESVPGGVGSRLGQLLDVAYTIEYGADAIAQSALNLLYLLGYSKKNQLQIFGESDERFRVRGGNDQVASCLATALSGQIVTGHELVAVAQAADGTVELTFAVGPTVRTMRVDKAVLALPFSLLRRSVDYSQAGFSALKQVAIRELGMGTNSKLHVQFNSRPWHALGSNGETYADTGYQNTWDASRAQRGRAGLLVNFTGGTIGAGLNQGSPTQYAQLFLQQAEPVLPGLGAAWNGRATLDYWTGHPWTRGSYSYWKPGQYTRFAGVEGAAEGNCHFCGEHTSVDYQGFLNGAVDTGERAAQEILDELGRA
jgi:monoamine oxidase